MAIFLNEDVVKLLWNKFVVIIGDSIQRGIYKDLVSMLQTNSYLSENNLKNKGEMRFMDDVLIEGGKKEEMNNGINYKEVRQFKTDYHLVRVYNKYMESIFDDLEKEPQADVVLMNSCLWDISRYGHSSMKLYKIHLEKTFHKMQRILDPECLFIWNTALPVANKIRGGFLLPGLEFLSETLRLDVLEGNFYAKEVAMTFEFDVLDLHFYFRGQLHRRVGDGVHWNHQAHRRISNLILSHISEAWGLSVPRRLELWQSPVAVPHPDSPSVAPNDGADGNFHSDIALSAPASMPQARRDCVSDDWGSLPQFIDFDKVASPKDSKKTPDAITSNTTTKLNQQANQQNASITCTSNTTTNSMKTPVLRVNGPSAAGHFVSGPIRSAIQQRQVQRYDPYGYGRGTGCAGGSGGGWNNTQGGNRRAVPLWRELEAKRRQRAQWEREEQFKWYGFRY